MNIRLVRNYKIHRHVTQNSLRKEKTKVSTMLGSQFNLQIKICTFITGQSSGLRLRFKFRRIYTSRVTLRILARSFLSQTHLNPLISTLKKCILLASQCLLHELPYSNITSYAMYVKLHRETFRTSIQPSRTSCYQ